MLEMLQAVAAEMRKRARRDVEIERKYLLSRMPRMRGARRQDIIQGYLPGTNIRERVRAISSANGKQYFRTLKVGSGMVRTEVEEEIGVDLFQKLWRLTRGRRIRKRRYLVETENGTWTIDKFKDRSLYLAEIELEDEHAEISIPTWLKDIIVSDVTDDPSYTNSALAR
jgi:adenylate cyclase